MKIASQKPATQIIPPNQMPEVAATAEQLLKLTISANELNFSIRRAEQEIRDLQSKLSEIRAAYADLKPKVLGAHAVLE